MSYYCTYIIKLQGFPTSFKYRIEKELKVCETNIKVKIKSHWTEWFMKQLQTELENLELIQPQSRAYKRKQV